MTHIVELPRRVVVGHDVLGDIAAICKDLGIEQHTLSYSEGEALVLSGPTTKKYASPILDSIRSRLEIVKEASKSEVERLMEVNDVTMVISVGGGKVIDVGKLLAFEKEIPFISVPTAPSHDGIVSERVTLRGNDNKKHSLKGSPPIAVVADLSIIKEAPYRLIASGAADAMSKYTSIYDWKLARAKGEYYSEYSASLSLLAADIVRNSADMIKEREERGLKNLINALVSSGIAMSIAGSSSPASGSEHLFSHALDEIAQHRSLEGNLHGNQCGVGSILASYLQGQDWKWVRDALKSVGAPTTASELGFSDDVVLEALLKAPTIRKRHTILTEKPLTREIAQKACETTGVTV
ncbi:MAG: iron-containing alcohol dehydrogenase [Candidatus Aenigmarchaeota archaeon]|nr:iron-containing alcohol dehydrogenase [Candidatus Aenigmarchaeota archaeon]